MQMTLASDRRESMELYGADGSRKLTTQTSQGAVNPLIPSHSKSISHFDPDKDIFIQ